MVWTKHEAQAAFVHVCLNVFEEKADSPLWKALKLAKISNIDTFVSLSDKAIQQLMFRDVRSEL